MYILLLVCTVNRDKNVYDGFRSYLVYSSKDIIGPITPTFSGPSFSNVQSCHSEVGTIKMAESLNKDPKKGKLVCTRWRYNQQESCWELDEGIPCTTCIKYIKKKGIKKIIVSTRDGLKEISLTEATKLSKPSTGLLYGR